ncbi:MAG: DNA translocase FtsK [Candidatus Symbiothrix sp.]|jgi:S-DNA-T family DNA segregation ATPase FtsK/SpoIIIE|nr:DNA translocase FtsK [Candidatus Symbiothrix sp.]
MGRNKNAKNGQEKQPSQIQLFLTSNVTHYLIGLLLLMIAVYATLALISFLFTGAADQSAIEGASLFGKIANHTENWTGKRGAVLSHILMNEGFGISTLFLLIYTIFIGLRLMKAKYFRLWRNFVVCALLTIWSSVALTFFFGSFFKETAYYIGGKHGFIVSALLTDNIGYPGTFLLLLLVFVVLMTILNADTIPFLQRKFVLKSKPKSKPQAQQPSEESEDDYQYEPPKPVQPKTSVVIPAVEPKTDTGGVKTGFTIAGGDEELPTQIPLPQPAVSTASKPLAVSDDEENDRVAERILAELGPYDPKADLSHYNYPQANLLKTYEQKYSVEDIREEQDYNQNRIIQTLKNFDIQIKSINGTVGPTVTLYEIVLEDGIRINKVRSLEDDIAMSLSALGIRIIAPMPGRGTIGIEVPNKDPQIVSMQSIITSKKFQETKYELPVALGRTITNDVFMVDLVQMPHLLVAGATGQGKSVGLNAAITSLLYKKHPAELKFVLIDPKMVEFSLYSVIEKHFLAKLPDAEKAIITDYTKVIYTLNSLCIEMDDRYKLLEDSKSRNVQEYNEKFIKRRLNPEKGHRYMPYMVVIIDEFGDLIMTAGKEIEQPIARIAQKARAVGMHMIIATQRPTTNIITGTIKANFPARIAFRVIAAVDSRTILDATGANQLVGRGDMLFFKGSDTTRIQCAFVDTPEVERVTKFIGNQQGYNSAFELPEYVGEETEKPNVDMTQLDPLFDEAAHLVVAQQQGSASLIQRKLQIGFARAGRIIDQLEMAGIVGPQPPGKAGGKPRDVLIVDNYSLEQKLTTIHNNMQ